MCGKRLGEGKTPPLPGQIGKQDNCAGFGIDQPRQSDANGENVYGMAAAQIVEQAAGSLHGLGGATLGLSRNGSLGHKVAAGVCNHGRDLGAANIDAGEQAGSGMVHEAGPPLRCDI